VNADQRRPPADFTVNETPSHSADETAPGGRVLVLEPDLDLAEKIRAALNEAAPTAEIDVAPTLEQAHGIILNAKPDLFVLDIDAVPDLSQEFLYDLRTSHPNARAIVLTGGHFAVHQEQAAGLGAIHFLEKPFRTETSSHWWRRCFRLRARPTAKNSRER